ncbi:hypothetical protein J5TS2_11660 [Brevibacillus halotolerans]|nr:hypothetical protein J5TS2_11660 [Brevibacillus halotolerans]
MPSTIVKSRFLTSLIIDPSHGKVELEEVLEFKEIIGQKLTTIGSGPENIFLPVTVNSYIWFVLVRIFMRC